MFLTSGWHANIIFPLVNLILTHQSHTPRCICKPYSRWSSSFRWIFVLINIVFFSMHSGSPTSFHPPNVYSILTDQSLAHTPLLLMHTSTSFGPTSLHCSSQRKLHQVINQAVIGLRNLVVSVDLSWCLVILLDSCWNPLNSVLSLYYVVGI